MRGIGELCALSGIEMDRFDERGYVITATVDQLRHMVALVGDEWVQHYDWIPVTERLPEPGQLIVKRFANRQVWAGNYSGSPKGDSFEAWKAI